MRQRNRGPDFEHIGEICNECFIRFVMAGNRKIEDAERLFTIGVEKIVLKPTVSKEIC